MRCQSCDYVLWHCTGRKCPECGDAFSLADYFFEPDMVLFHCPHCDHGVKGQLPQGRPDARLKKCEACGEAICLETFIVRPIGGGDPYEQLLPIRGTRSNWIVRYFQTVWLIIRKPQEAISRVPVHEPLIRAWEFFFATIGIALVLSMVPIFLIISVPILAGYSGFGSGLFIAWHMSSVFSYLFLSVFLSIIWPLLAHLMLQLTGGSAFTLRRTMQTVLYSSGGLLFCSVPFIGPSFGVFFCVLLTGSMLMKGQRVGQWRAIAAALTAPMLILILLVFNILFSQQSIPLGQPGPFVQPSSGSNPLMRLAFPIE